MVERLFQELARYIDFLRETYQLQITVHDRSGFCSNYFNYIAPYNVHSNEFCLLVKTNEEIWTRCSHLQTGVMQKCCGDGICFGMCYAGVEEYVVPIRSGEKKLGFLSVSGYRVHTEKALSRIQQICEEYHFDRDVLVDCYYRSLKTQIPSAQWIETLLAPAARILELAYLLIIEEQGGIMVPQTTDNDIYGHMLAYIGGNFTKQITVKKLSEFCHCSNSYVSHIFKKKSGKNIKQYINELRVKKAMRLLAITDLPIREISSMVGFEDSNYFTNLFSKINGVSPKRYRSSVIEAHPSVSKDGLLLPYSDKLT